MKQKGRKTYVETHIALASTIDRPAHAGRLANFRAHPQQPRRIDYAKCADKRTGYSVAANLDTNLGTSVVLASLINVA